MGETAAPADIDTSKGLFLNLPIVKIDEAKHEVWGFGTTEDLDIQNEVVDYGASKEAFAEWSGKMLRASGGKSLGNVREMHQPKVPGHLIAISPDDVRKGIWVGAKVNPETKDGKDAWAKVMSGELTGFSIGAPYAERKREYLGEKPVTRVTKYTLAEISLVDNPACPGSFFQMAKSAGSLVATSDALDVFEVGAKPGGADYSVEAIRKAALEKRVAATQIKPTIPDLVSVPSIDPNSIVDGVGDVYRYAGGTFQKDEAASMLLKRSNWKPKTPQEKKWVSSKIETLMNEGKKQDQAIAIAYSMAEDHFTPKKEASAMSDMKIVLTPKTEIKKDVVGPVQTGNAPLSPAPYTEPAKGVIEGQGSASPAPDLGGVEGNKAAPPGHKEPDGDEMTCAYCAGMGKVKKTVTPVTHDEGPRPTPGPSAKAATVPAPDPAAPTAEPKTAAAMGDDLMKSIQGAIKSAVSEGFRDIQKQIVPMGAVLEDVKKRLAVVEKTPLPGGPMAAELPDGIRPVEKGSVQPNGADELLTKLSTKIREEKDPNVREALGKMAAELQVTGLFAAASARR